MTIVIAAYLRMICQYPELNRFVKNRKIYARKKFVVSFVVLKKISETEVIETVVKAILNPTDTLIQVTEKIEDAIKINRDLAHNNSMDKFVSRLMDFPLLPRFSVDLIKLFDLIGILPEKIIDLSPFHTSLFISNMASINMNYIYHHVYEFGTTSIFLAMGKKEKEQITTESGASLRITMPIGVVTDERICPGITYAKAFKLFNHFVTHPELLEYPPDKIREDVK